jgi:hypothetical protein
MRSVVLVGSAALGDYVAGVSDLDVAAVSHGPVDDPVALAAPLRHCALACPARRLEFVVYRAEQAAAPARGLEFELDLNTGADGDRLLTEPGEEPAHWYLIDLAIARERGVTLAGAPAGEAIGEPPRGDLLDALLAGLSWSVEAEPLAPSTALNAARAWCFAEEGRWLSKAEAAAWGERRGARTGLARRARERGGALEPGVAPAVAERAMDAVEAAR